MMGQGGLDLFMVLLLRFGISKLDACLSHDGKALVLGGLMMKKGMVRTELVGIHHHSWLRYTVLV